MTGRVGRAFHRVWTGRWHSTTFDAGFIYIVRLQRSSRVFPISVPQKASLISMSILVANRRTPLG